MMKKVLITGLCLSLILSVGCNENENQSSNLSEIKSSSVVSPVEFEETVENYCNPLTGIPCDSADLISKRPIAIMIDNHYNAQVAQTGLDSADIIYETETDDDETRILAVYQSIKEIEQIGPVESYGSAFLDLALGHNAIYVHSGEDINYSKKELTQRDDINLLINDFSVRIPNGLPAEHTTYICGNVFLEKLNAKKWKINNENTENWQKFSDISKSIFLQGGKCNSIMVNFTGTYSTQFRYDEHTKTYIRYSGTKLLKDGLSNTSTSIKNVFVLLTDVSDDEDGHNRKILLSGGKGYYFVNGTFAEIIWEKGEPDSSLVFKNTDGSPLAVNAGDSWVCIADKKTSSPILL